MQKFPENLKYLETNAIKNGRNFIFSYNNFCLGPNNDHVKFLEDLLTSFISTRTFNAIEKQFPVLLPILIVLLTIAHTCHNNFFPKNFEHKKERMQNVFELFCLGSL